MTPAELTGSLRTIVGWLITDAGDDPRRWQQLLDAHRFLPEQDRQNVREALAALGLLLVDRQPLTPQQLADPGRRHVHLPSQRAEAGKAIFPVDIVAEGQPFPLIPRRRPLAPADRLAPPAACQLLPAHPVRPSLPRSRSRRVRCRAPGVRSAPADCRAASSPAPAGFNAHGSARSPSPRRPHTCSVSTERPPRTTCQRSDRTQCNSRSPSPETCSPWPQQRPTSSPPSRSAAPSSLTQSPLVAPRPASLPASDNGPLSRTWKQSRQHVTRARPCRPSSRPGRRGRGARATNTDRRGMKEHGSEVPYPDVSAHLARLSTGKAAWGPTCCIGARTG